MKREAEALLDALEMRLGYLMDRKALTHIIEAHLEAVVAEKNAAIADLKEALADMRERHSDALIASYERLDSDYLE
jgi:hypothetical protein